MKKNLILLYNKHNFIFQVSPNNTNINYNSKYYNNNDDISITYLVDKVGGTRMYVEGITPNVIPYITSLTINNVEQCKNPKVVSIFSSHHIDKWWLICTYFQLVLLYLHSLTINPCFLFFFKSYALSKYKENQ